jgi:hypothetical protein
MVRHQHRLRMKIYIARAKSGKFAIVKQRNGE